MKEAKIKTKEDLEIELKLNLILDGVTSLILKRKYIWNEVTIRIGQCSKV
jgi:hypothetical protein